MLCSSTPFEVNIFSFFVPPKKEEKRRQKNNAPLFTRCAHEKSFLWPTHPGLGTNINFDVALPGLGP